MLRVSGLCFIKDFRCQAGVEIGGAGRSHSHGGNRAALHPDVNSRFVSKLQINGDSQAQNAQQENQSCSFETDDRIIDDPLRGRRNNLTQFPHYRLAKSDCDQKRPYGNSQKKKRDLRDGNGVRRACP
ncbi:MAG: hypothetical protein IPJ25_07200 [Rhodocyclaceae bacterium]|nr:hypothetical protein [Rhodocyclaceae bacterium]